MIMQLTCVQLCTTGRTVAGSTQVLTQRCDLHGHHPHTPKPVLPGNRGRGP